MPLPAGTKYRYKKGTDVRLAFNPSGKVIEAKKMKRGTTPKRARGGADDLPSPQAR